MAETRYCYVCHVKENKDVKMVFRAGRGPYGAYECPNCGHYVEKKTSGDTGEKYI